MKLLVVFLIICAFMISADQTQAQQPATPVDLRKLADDYYNWRNQNFPVASSDAGLHTWDNKLTDYGLASLLARRLHVKEVLGKVRAMQTAGQAATQTAGPARTDWSWSQTRTSSGHPTRLAYRPGR